MEILMKKLLLFFTFIYSYAYVTVSILPQKFVVDKITNKTIDVNVIIPKGASPAIYSPKPSELLKLKKSKVYFIIGVPFEKAWLNKFRSINSNIVSFAKYIKKDKNPHIWLDPIFLISQAKVVYETLSQIYPNKKEFFYKNFLLFKKECLEFDNYAKTHLNHQKFIIFH
jgi:zinc transport system substrate-binding protein